MARPKGIPAWNKGLHPSIETRKKMSESKIGKAGNNLGKRHSEETKKLIGEKSREVWSNPEYRKRMSDFKKLHPLNYWLGKKRPSPSLETRRRMSEAQKRIGNKPPVRYGEKNNKWKGGISKNCPYKHYRNKEYIYWRKQVFERDNYTCQLCGIRGGVILHPHHLKSYTRFPEFRYDVNNGKTLCIDCHREIHFNKN